MSWGRNDDNMLEHLKWKMLEDDPREWADALALWSAARDYANRASTDGFIPDVCLRSLTPMEKKRAKVIADLLVSAKPPGYASGLWERVEGGYQIHDFLKYNESRASKAAKADQERANAEQAEAERNAERAADAARKRTKRAGQKPDASDECPPDVHRTSPGQSTGQHADASPDNPPDASRPRAPAQAPAPAHAYVRARDPGPARPDPTQIDLDRKGDLDHAAPSPPSRSVTADQIRKGFARAYADATDTPPPMTRDVDGKPWHALVDFGRVEAERHSITVEEVGNRLGQGARKRKRFNFTWLVDNPKEFFDAAPANTLGGGESAADVLRDLTGSPT